MAPSTTGQVAALEGDDGQNIEVGSTPGSAKRSFWRSVPFQVIIASFVSFTTPGMWDALGGLGAGGAAEPYAVSAANSVTYGLFAILCIFVTGAVTNRIGLKYGLALGTIGYPLYGGGLYTNSVTSNTWLLVFGAAMTGISAGFYFTAEAAIIIGYPAPKERGFYLAIWAMAKAIGPIIGGAINLGFNAQRDFSGSISSVTYIVFIAIMCLGLPAALCLSPAQKVWRKNGTKIIVEKAPSWKNEFFSVWKLLISRRILLLIPAFFTSYFWLGIQSTWLTTYFTVRARALSSFLTFFAGIFSSFLIGYLLDRQSIHIKTRARIGFISVISVMVGTWIWACILQKRYYDLAESPVYDWDSPEFPSGYLLVFFWYFGGQAFQQFLYWLVGQYTTNLSSLSHHSGILRGFEALGQTVAWAMQTQGNANHFTSIGLNFALTVCCAIPAWIVISELEHSHEETIHDSEESQGGQVKEVKG